MGERVIRKLFDNPYAGIKVASLFFLWVVVSEYSPQLFNKDIGAFIWITFHFIINPILGIFVCLFLIWHGVTQKQLQPKLLSIIAVVFPLFISYVGFSGNTWFVELLGINFN